MGRLRNWAGEDLVRLRGELREGAQTIGDNSSENGRADLLTTLAILVSLPIGNSTSWD